jgi:hypothetical protein
LVAEEAVEVLVVAEDDNHILKSKI